jgi:probable rRNA maturation factor
MRSIYRPPWRIDLAVRPSVHLPVPAAALARWAADALDATNAPRPSSLGVVLSDDRELAALDAAHLGVEGPTDVLSFPSLPPAAFAPGRSAAALAEDPRPPRTRLHLGDVIVSVERAREQATDGRGGQTGDVRWSVEEELRLLVTHGVLHICGWDHAEPAEERAMRALERRILGADLA